MNELQSSANPLLLTWVKEWLDFAREKNTRGVTTYKHAYDSLKSCPITFQHPGQLQQLRGFGPKLCERLTDKLKEHCTANGLPMPKMPRKRLVLPGQEDDDEADQPLQAPKKPRKKKPYVPSYRSGAYAIVLALANLDEDIDARQGMTKQQVIEIAQPLCDSSFTAPSDPTKFYTAWNSIKTLLDRDLVYEKGRPIRKYSLTDEGWDVAKRIQAVGEPGQGSRSNAPPAAPAASAPPAASRSLGGGGPTAAKASRNTRLGGLFLYSDDDEDSDVVALDELTPSFPKGSTSRKTKDRSISIDAVPEPKNESQYHNVVSDGAQVSSDSSLPQFTPIRLPPGSFTVELLLDVREVRAKKDRDYMQEELLKLGIKPLMRSLDLGDAQWVARCNDPAMLTRLGAEGEEVVLDYIVERKRLDDLVASIRDGRFHEQKFRLRKSGVKNVIYIVEEISMDSTQFSKIEEAVTSAIAQIQVVNGYFLKRTQKMDDTIRYLARMTTMLKKMYEGKTLMVIPARILTAHNYLPLLKHLRERDPAGSYYISYPAFSSIASKSDMLTLKDLFLKMLMTTRGVTGEKAVEIQKRWKTPCQFVKAYEDCGGSGEVGKKRKREMVANELAGVVAPRKKVGKALSGRIAEVWGDV